jgi:hypothetical protein
MSSDATKALLSLCLEIFEALEAEGFRPDRSAVCLDLVTVSMHPRGGDVGRCDWEAGLAVLHRLTSKTPVRSDRLPDDTDRPGYSVFAADRFLVFTALHPDAIPSPDEAHGSP